MYYEDYLCGYLMLMLGIIVNEKVETQVITSSMNENKTDSGKRG